MKKVLCMLLAVFVLFTSVDVTGLQVQAEEVQETEKKSIKECTFVESQGEVDGYIILPSQKYTGSEIIPSVTIKDGDYTLVEGVDYSVSPYAGATHSANVDVNPSIWGEYAFKCPIVTVYGIGAYEGNQILRFAILAENQKETPDHFIYSDKEVVSGYDGVTIDGYVGTETEVIIPDYIDGKPVQAISDFAFAYNPVLAKVDISDNVVVIGKDAFVDCSNLKEAEVSKKLQAIDTEAFAGCTSLEEIYLPGTVQLIGLGIFVECTTMKAVHVQAEQVYDVDGVLFTTELGTNDLYFYPPAKQMETYCIPDGTEEIGVDAFRDVGNVKNVIIPESVKAVYGGQHGSFFEMAGSVNIIYKHNTPTNSILGSGTFYDLPAGSTVTVKNEAMKAAAEAAISSKCAGNVTVVIDTTPAESLTCPESSITISKDGTHQLTWTQTPADTTDNVTWTSSDDEVASVDSIYGTIKATGYGNCTITGIDESGHSVTVDVLVYDKCTRKVFQIGRGLKEDSEHGSCMLPEVESGQEEGTIYVGGNGWTYAVADGYAGDMPVRFVSSKEDIVKIGRVNPSVYDEAIPWVTGAFTSEDYGMRKRNYTEVEILGIKPGTATITAIFDDNGKEIRDSITVHVIGEDTVSPTDPADPTDPTDPADPEHPTNPTVKKKNQAIKYTKSYQKAYGNKAFKLNVKRTKGNGKLTYNSSNKKVAVVNSQGKVMIKGTGRTIITVTAAATEEYNKKSVKITVDVSPKKQIASVKAVKGRKLTVKWKKDTRATGYQIQYSMDKKFKKGVKTTAVTKNKTTGKTISKLKKGKTYYVRVRSYKIIKTNGKTKKLYGSWSSVKKTGKIK